MSGTPWQCPHCPHQVTDLDDGVRKIAANSHLKSHGKKPDGPRFTKGGSPGSSKKGSWLGEIVDEIGDAVGDVIGKILD